MLLLVAVVEKFGAYLSYNPEWQTLPPIRESLVFQELQKTDSHTLTLVNSRLALEPLEKAHRRPRLFSRPFKKAHF